MTTGEALLKKADLEETRRQRYAQRKRVNQIALADDETLVIKGTCSDADKP